MNIENLFLSVGAMKCGTTWLYENLRTHPQIQFTPEKELHFFAHHYSELKPIDRHYRKVCAERNIAALLKNGLTRQRVRQIEWYLRYYQHDFDLEWFENNCVVQNKSTFMADFSNLTCHIDDSGWDFINSITNNLKVIYTVRCPLERLWSHTKFHARYSGNTKILEEGDESVVLAFIEEHKLVKEGDFVKVISQLERNLNKDQLMILNSEKFFDFPDSSLREIENFLSIKHYEYKKKDSVINATDKSPVPEYIKSRYSDLIIEQKKGLESLGYRIL